MLDHETPWHLFARKYPTLLNDTVERTAYQVGMESAEMASQLLDLMERHIVQWQNAQAFLESKLGFYQAELHEA